MIITIIIEVKAFLFYIVELTTSIGGTAQQADFTALTNSAVTFNANDANEKMVCIEVVDDCDVETTDETFTVTVSNPTGGMENITPSRGMTVITIQDNDGKPPCYKFF